MSHGALFFKAMEHWEWSHVDVGWTHSGGGGGSGQVGEGGYVIVFDIGFKCIMLRMMMISVVFGTGGGE